MQDQALNQNEVEVHADHLLIKNLKVDGPVFESVMAGTLENKNPATMIREILNIGSIALQAASGNNLLTQIGQAINNFGEKITKEATVDFPRVIEEKTKSFITSELAKYLDPKQVESLQNQVKNVLAESVKSMEDHRQKWEVSQESHQKSVMQQIESLLGFQSKIKSAGTLGNNFEDKVFSALQSIAGTDTVENVSKESGGRSTVSGNGKSGDFLVHAADLIDPNKKISFVVESKFRSNKESLNQATKELSKNMENRNVHVGIIVYPSVEVSPVQKVFSVQPNNQLIVVLDDSTTALEAAYTYAKSVATYYTGVDSSDIPKQLLENAISEIENKIDLESTLNQAAKNINKNLNEMIEKSLDARKQVINRLKRLLEK